MHTHFLSTMNSSNITYSYFYKPSISSFHVHTVQWRARLYRTNAYTANDDPGATQRFLRCCQGTRVPHSPFYINRKHKDSTGQLANKRSTYPGGGRSVEYSSTLRSASKMARMPRTHRSCSQNLQRSSYTGFVLKDGCKWQSW